MPTDDVALAPSRVASPLPVELVYDAHLNLCRDWLLHSAAAGNAGSRATLSPVTGWSRAYPETTGYLIPTLLNLSGRLKDGRPAQLAAKFGRWLVDIQSAEGFWRSGLYPYNKGAAPSVFNTAQILLGLVHLSRQASSDLWREAASRAAHWLAAGVNREGLWQSGHYLEHQPSYYAYVAWPMLEFAGDARSIDVGDAAARVLARVVECRSNNGVFRGWGFRPAAPAFTHTMAYTLQGLLESARLTGDFQAYGAPAVKALERLCQAAELSNGRLPGAFDDEWKPDRSFECLTGSAQTAICLLLLHNRAPDLRLVNAAAKLADRVCALQCWGPGKARRGALAGSYPIWGRYMRARYPNWAVKFLADSLLMLSKAIAHERSR